MSTPELDAFAAGIEGAWRAPLPERVRRSAERALLNIASVVAGAERTAGVQRLAAHLRSDSGTFPIGVSDLLEGAASAHDSALVTGFAGHYDDFDDTHLATVIHPSAACFGVAWPLGFVDNVTGDQVLRAFAIGCEAQLRLGMAVSPEHYHRGWHITGTCGVMGATVTAALLQGLEGDTLAAALAIACTRTLGHREGFGTETKPLHAGLAAAAGIEIADQATAFTKLHPSWREGADPIGQLLDAFAPRSADHHLLGIPWGSADWEIERNAFKPYPCGIVAHPGIDAAIAVGEQMAALGRRPEEIQAVRYRAHPLVEELMGRVDPETSLQARFSARHGVAAGLRYRAAGIAEFEDKIALDEEMRRLRFATEVQTDSSLARDEAEVEVVLVDGVVLREHVAHARGSEARALTDQEVRAKAAALLAFSGSPVIDDLASTVLALQGSAEPAWTGLRSIDAEEPR